MTTAMATVRNPSNAGMYENVDRTVLITRSVHGNRNRNTMMHANTKALLASAISQDENAHMSVAVITGASRGIGRAIALAFVKNGHTVALHARHHSDAFNETLNTVRALEPRCTGHVGDIGNEDDVRDFVNHVVDAHKTVDICVNNAGILRNAKLQSLTMEHWDTVLDTNLKGVFLLTKYLTPHMRDDGRIINVSSIAALKGFVGQANYAASKAGILGLTRALAAELASRNITVNAICPGPTDTDMLQGIPETYLAKLKESIPLKRFGTPEEVAALAVFLSSEQAGYITGQSICIDGGLI